MSVFFLCQYHTQSDTALSFSESCEAVFLELMMGWDLGNSQTEVILHIRLVVSFFLMGTRALKSVSYKYVVANDKMNVVLKSAGSYIHDFQHVVDALFTNSFHSKNVLFMCQ